MIENYQHKNDNDYGICSHVIISDRYALTTTDCWFVKYESYEFNKEKLRIIIRQDTEFEEVMNVKRFWFNPWRRSSGTYPGAYYNIAIIEFGNFLSIFYFL